LSNDETVCAVIKEDNATTEEGGEKSSARSAGNFCQLDSEALDTTRPFHDSDETGEKESKEVDVSVATHVNVRQGSEDVSFQSKLLHVLFDRGESIK